MKRAAIAAVMCLPLIGSIVVRAGADDATEARLRDALRTTTEQLHRLEAENAVLQSKRSAAPVAPVASEKASAGSSRVIADLKRRLTVVEQEAAKAKTAYAEALSAAQKKDADNAQAMTGVAADKDKLAACQIKNEALLKIGFELLDRYENTGFGDVLGRREPFTGIKRVELQNIAQDTREKLRDNAVKP
ncbi:type IV secretory pathway VirJ component [Rhizomicrobium palustre]|uniref:Type IV secretory pathway VirJ component n=1 Tax=Rhizomicrobium palustre TaxID=189966 RepID=A0A846N1F4_9PROT|nr:hypothetical protein [Rhizomicrobium palustre]NIK88960.1 type IV secretory pathway VirJ component [Rhizomicrobium palustre]